MSAQRTALTGTSNLSVALPLGNGEAAYGELQQPQDPGSIKGIALLLHDRDGDLDEVRAFASPLRSLRIMPLLLDLPGHGLSAGAWETHGVHAVDLAVQYCRDRFGPPAMLALGASAELALRAENAGCPALALIGPAIGPDDLVAGEAWRRTPQVAIGDPGDPAAHESLDLLGGWVRAWSLRIHSSYLQGRTPETAWPTQLTYAATAFIAEQVAYATANVGAATPRTREERS